MAKMVIDCADPNDMDAVDRAIEKAIGSCNITYFRQHQAMVGASVSSSERESSRIIADEAGEDPESVRNKIRKGKVEVGIEYPDTPIENESHSAVKPRDTIATKWTGDPEGYTPKEYIESARLVMGSIDVDPASNEYANEVVKAKTYFTIKDNGLSKTWVGNVFLNPPYSHPEIKHFISKLIGEVLSGNTFQAILLTNNNTDTQWFHDAVKASQAVCFTKGRINFYKPDGSITHPTNGQAFYYFGNDVDAFSFEFKKHGLVMVRF